MLKEVRQKLNVAWIASKIVEMFPYRLSPLNEEKAGHFDLHNSFLQLGINRTVATYELVSAV